MRFEITFCKIILINNHKLKGKLRMRQTSLQVTVNFFFSFLIKTAHHLYIYFKVQLVNFAVALGFAC